MAKKKNTGGSLATFKPRPDPETMKLARQNGYKAALKRPKKAKTEEQAKKAAATWNAKVDTIHQRAASQRKLNATNEKIGAL